MSDAQNTDKNTSKVKYYIEGTVSEIAKTKTGNSFQILGTEGYGLCQRKSSGFEKCNVLCEQGKIVQENKKPIHSLKMPTDFIYRIDNEFLELLIPAMVNGKKVQVVFEETDGGKIEIDCKKFDVSSITILTD